MKTILPCFLLECAQNHLVQNQDDFRQPHLQEYFYCNFTYNILFKGQLPISYASYTPEMLLFSYILPHN